MVIIYSFLCAFLPCFIYLLMKNRKEKKKVRSKLERLLEFPTEISTGEPKINMLGYQEILIENFKGILEYEDFYIKISTYIGNININGFNLSLNQMTEDDIMVTGKIQSIDIEDVLEGAS